jgi:hypothetical protein
LDACTSTDVQFLRDAARLGITGVSAADYQRAALLSDGSIHGRSMHEVDDRKSIAHFGRQMRMKHLLAGPHGPRQRGLLVAV